MADLVQFIFDSGCYEITGGGGGGGNGAVQKMHSPIYMYARQWVSLNTMKT